MGFNIWASLAPLCIFGPFYCDSGSKSFSSKLASLSMLSVSQKSDPGGPLLAPARRKILDALFFRPRQQLVLRLKSPAAVGRIAVEGQVELQAV